MSTSERIRRGFNRGLQKTIENPSYGYNSRAAHAGLNAAAVLGNKAITEHQKNKRKKKKRTR